MNIDLTYRNNKKNLILSKCCGKKIKSQKFEQNVKRNQDADYD